MKVIISTRALEARMKRHFAKDGSTLRKCREDSRWFSDFGSYYVVNSDNCVIEKDMDLEGWARELNIIKEYEEVATD